MLTLSLFHSPAGNRTWGNIPETERHNEILRVYSQSREPARTLYEEGHYATTEAQENWVIRWSIRQYVLFVTLSQ